MTERPYQLLPPLDEEQRHLLRQSIAANGVLEPVVFDEDGEILDGHHRVEIAEELDIEYPRRVVTDLDEAGKRRYAITTNVARRQLSSTVRSGLVAQLRMQGMSIRQIAESTGINRETVRRDLSGDTDVSPERITGLDGKTYASTRPASTPGPSDAAVTPPVDPSATPAPAVESPRAPVPPQEPDPLVAVAAMATAADPAALIDAALSQPVIPPPGSPATWTTEEKAANQREVDRKRMVADGQKVARTLVMSVRAEISTVVSAIDLGEKNLITAQMIADLRRAIDLLESRLEASA